MKQPRGAAIIASLFMLVLVAMLANAMVRRQGLATSRAQLLTGYYQLYFAARGAQDFVAQSLEKDLTTDPNSLKGLNSKKVEVMFPQGIEGEVRLTALGGRFNINSLTYQADQAIFKRLLSIAGVQLSEEEMNELIQALVSRGVSERSKQRLISAEQVTRRLRSDLMPINTNLGFVSVSQMRTVAHMSAGDYMRLAPFLTALPMHTLIDVNAASESMLEALSPDIDPTIARAVIEERQIKPFDTVFDFVKFPPLQGKSIPQSLIYDQSQYFLLQISVKLAKQSLMIYSILSTTPHFQGSKTVNFIWQTQATL